MSLRTALLPALDQIRSILGPSGLDLRPTSITVVQRFWSGGRRGVGTSTDTTVAAIPPFVKVRQVKQREVAESGGRYEIGDVIAGPITPAYTNPTTGATGGFTEAQLDPPVTTQGVENVYILGQQSGATGIVGEYQLVDFKSRDRAFRFELVLRRRATSP